jgi:UDP-glucose 4-epimerase
VVEANMLAMNSKKGFGEAFNIGTGKGTSINRLADAVKHVMGKEDLQDVHTEPRPADIKHGYANIVKAKEALGYEPRFSMAAGLAELVDWYTKKR